MRRALWILAAAGVAAVLAIGILQARDGTPAEQPRAATSLDTLLRPLEGSPPELAALHDAANTIVPADYETYRAQLAELRGRPVVVNAWASWCGPCKLEFPIFQRVAAQLGRRVAFLGLNVSDNRGEAEAFLRKVPVPYPHLEDGSSRILQQAGGGGGLPVTLYYDEQGERAYIHQGPYRTADDLVRDIRRYAGA